MTAPGSPTLEATASQASRASSPHAPRFLSTLSPRKSAASTTTVSVTAATPRTQGQQEDAASTAGGAAMSRSTSLESSVSALPGSPSEDLSLSMRIGSAMNAQFPTLASLEAAPAATVSGSDSQAKGEVDKGKAAQRDGLPSTPQEATQSSAEGVEPVQPSSSTSPWAWTSRAATGSMSFFKQGADAAANGLGSALRTNPFRNLSGAFGGEGASSPQEAAGPSASAPASTSKPGPSAGLPESSAHRAAAPATKEADEDEDDDVNLVRSAADSLRLGAKNEEKRRRRVQEHTRNQARRQQAKASTSKASASTDGGAGPASSLFASAGSFLLPLRRESPSTSRSASPAPPLPPPPQASNSSSASATSATPTDINYFDFPTTWPEAERPPSPTSPLPSRRYFVLTQAGKPVFLSHLAQRRLAREDAARARLRAAREAQRKREERLADPEVTEEEEKRALLDEEEQARLAEDEARKLEAQESDRDEEDAAIQVGVLQALVSNFSSHGPQHLESKSIEILKLPAKSSRVIFLLREPLYLAVTSTWHGAGYLYEDAETTLRGHLEVLYAGIVSLISEAQLKRLFARGHNFDLRRMLEGTDGIVESLVARMQTDFGLSLGAGGGGVCLRPMRVDLRVREDLNACLSLEAWERRPLGKALAAAAAGDQNGGEGSRPSSSSSAGNKNKPLDPAPLLTSRQPPRPKDLIYVLLITPDLELVTLVRPRRLSAYPLDLHLLINMVAGMSRRGQREAGTVNWVPICLPRFAPQGMVQAHISWLKVGSGSANGEGGGAGAAAANGDTAAAKHSRAGSSSSTISQRTGTSSSPCALVIVTADRESFDEISRYRDYILSLLSLPSTTLPKSPSPTSHTTPPSPLTSLHHSLPLTRIAPDSLHLPGLWHFVLKKKDDLQVVWSEWLVDGYTGEGREAVLARERVTRAYERCREVCVLRAKERRGGEKRRRKKQKAEAEAEAEAEARGKEKEKAEVKEKEQAGAPAPAAAGGNIVGETAREEAEEPNANEAGKVPAIVVAGEEGEDDGPARLASTPVNGESGEGVDDEDASNGDAAGEDIPATAASLSSLLPPQPPSPLAPPTSSNTSSSSAASSPSASNSYTYYLRTTHEAIYVDCPPSTTTSSSATSPVSSPYEIYLTLSPHVPPATAKRIARAVLLWGLGEGNGAERSGGGEGGAPRGERWRLWLGRGGSVL